MTKNKIILAGGSGFLGRTLAKWYNKKGWEVIVFSRREYESNAARCVTWDGENIGDWVDELEGARAIINLAGRSVNCRYTAANRRKMMDSRVLSTRILGQAISECKIPPQVWLNSSTATIYTHTYSTPHGEDGSTNPTREAKDEFSIEIAKAWEKEFNTAYTPATRKVTLRTAMVFGREPGGVFEVLHRLTRFGLGGRMSHGRQFVSWIHEVDFCRSMDWLIENDNAEGIYNICAPEPLTNSEMMAILRKACKMPIGLPAARWMLEIGTFFMRTETELIIKSRRVVPSRLRDEGFDFNFSRLEPAIADLVKFKRQSTLH
jgi:uncharacterized protein (TIGR01777 family)